MDQDCFRFGPYKGYRGAAVQMADDGRRHDRVTDIQDVVTFEADDPGAADRAFTESIDHYLAFCEQRNESPDIPRS